MPRTEQGLKNHAKAKRNWAENNPDYATTYRLAHPEKWRISGAKNNARLKMEIFSHYSPTGLPECSNPYGQHKEPYHDVRALSIDHINGDGSEERRRLSGRNIGIGGRSFYLWLKRNNFPEGRSFYLWLKRNNFPEGYQILCRNCQAIKVIVNKENSQINL